MVDSCYAAESSGAPEKENTSLNASTLDSLETYNMMYYLDIDENVLKRYNYKTIKNLQDYMTDNAVIYL